ncbi:hypothetical protein BGW42_007903 [Actinomortierella wolfii]|nr:hypothetical protein BGW42_007903 [Actinomortierella wolfii]
MARFYDVVINNHHSLEECYNRVLESKTSNERACRRNEFVWGVARQIVAEDLVFYPTLEKVLSDSGQYTSKKDLTRKKVKDLLVTLQEMSPSSPDFESMVRKVWNMYSGHFKEVEVGELQKLEENLSKIESSDLARAFGRTKHLIPTPYVYDQHKRQEEQQKPLTFETVSSLLRAPIDRVRDALRDLPHEE